MISDEKQWFEMRAQRIVTKNDIHETHLYNNNEAYDEMTSWHVQVALMSAILQRRRECWMLSPHKITVWTIVRSQIHLINWINGQDEWTKVDMKQTNVLLFAN